MKKRVQYLHVIFGGALLALFSGSVAADEASLIKQGKKTFRIQCARCHGVQGRGNGSDAKRLLVEPRNLVEDDYKFKTTAYGTPPSDDDLMHVLNYGMSGAGMPSYSNLPMDKKKALIAYIKSISNQWGEYEPEPVEPPNEKVKPNLKKGKEVFDTLQCALCHGPSGRANGTASAGLAVKPANLTQGWTYRAGNSPKQIYYRLTTGIAGSGMPSYSEAGFTNVDLWHLANYVHSLQLETNWSLSVIAHEVSGELPLSTEDLLWESAPRSDIHLESSFYKNGEKHYANVNAVSVQILTNETEMAFRLSWNDTTASTQNPPDSLLLAFRPKEMGDNIQANLYSLYRPDAALMDVVKWRADDSREVNQGVSNIHSVDRSRWKGANVFKAASDYKDGLWTLVYKRPRLGDSEPSLVKKGLPQFIGFAVWDGANQEKGLKRATSVWIDLKQATTHSHY